MFFLSLHSRNPYLPNTEISVFCTSLKSGNLCQSRPESVLSARAGASDQTFQKQAQTSNLCGSKYKQATTTGVGLSQQHPWDQVHDSYLRGSRPKWVTFSEAGPRKQPPWVQTWTTFRMAKWPSGAPSELHEYLATSRVTGNMTLTPPWGATI